MHERRGRSRLRRREKWENLVLGWRAFTLMRQREGLAMTKIMRRFVGLAILLACGLGTPEGMAWAGAPKNAHKTVYGGGVLTPDTKHICPAGPFAFYVYHDGHSACLAPGQFPPRSPADCPKGTTFTIMTSGRPDCYPGLSVSHFPPTDAYPNRPVQCRTDADCPNGGFCYVNPFGRGGQCGEPPGYHPTVRNNR